MDRLVQAVDVVDTANPMAFALFGVIGIVVVVAAGAFSKKLGIAAPLLLILIGFGFSYLPGAPSDVPHELILMGLLPPILYSAAINVPIVDFRRNFSSISALSVVLVVVTAFGTGLILFNLFPDLDLAAAIAIGAVISPTDAVAATALGKKLGLPARLVTILEGESLVNDATALVLLRSAIAATAATVSVLGRSSATSPSPCCSRSRSALSSDSSRCSCARSCVTRCSTPRSRSRCRSSRTCPRSTSRRAACSPWWSPGSTPGIRAPNGSARRRASPSA